MDYPLKKENIFYLGYFVSSSIQNIYMVNQSSKGCNFILEIILPLLLLNNLSMVYKFTSLIWLLGVLKNDNDIVWMFDKCAIYVNASMIGCSKMSFHKKSY